MVGVALVLFCVVGFYFTSLSDGALGSEEGWEEAPVAA